MKAFNRIITVLCTIITVFSSYIVFADTSDPVISLSYLNEVFAPAFKEEIKKLIPDSSSELKSDTFSIVTIPSGKTFIGEQGCEFVLRSGSATAVIAESGGLCDVTAGVDLGARSLIPANHLIIIPRSDWRGFVASGDVIVMVKGKYSIN